MTATQFYNFHRSLFDNWEYGEIKKVWTDAAALNIHPANGGITMLTARAMLYFGRGIFNMPLYKLSIDSNAYMTL